MTVAIGTMLFNPFTGTPRHPSDIASDPRGILIWDGEEPLRAYKPAPQPTDIDALMALAEKWGDAVCDTEAADLDTDAAAENDTRFAVYAKLIRRCARAIRSLANPAERPEGEKT